MAPAARAPLPGVPRLQQCLVPPRQRPPAPLDAAGGPPPPGVYTRTLTQLGPCLLDDMLVTARTIFQQTGRSVYHSLTALLCSN